MPGEDEPDSVMLRARARVGTVLRGKYRIDRVLGVGGMAVVYKATHRNQAQFAVKMLHPELSMREDVRVRFLREGYAANSVKHPGAVAVVDDDIDESGAAFLVMELLDGAPLESLWEQCGQRLPLRAVLTVADQLLDVLAAAHEKGIVHRDIKPENLFATRDGTLKVLDFGIARLIDATSAPGSGKGTGTGMVLGTPAFMAPEQAYAKASEIDGQTDVWAVGATLFTLLTGQPVHIGDNAAQLMIQAATTRARSVSTLDSSTPPSLAYAIDRALAFEKSARWASAVDMRAAILRSSQETLGEPPSKAALAALVPARDGVASSPGVPGGGWGSDGSGASSGPRAVVRSGPGLPAVGTAPTVASQAVPLVVPEAKKSRVGLAVGLGAAALMLGIVAGVAIVRSRPPPVTEAPATVDAAVDASPAAEEKAHKCASEDVADCTAQCAKHDAPSCVALGFMLRNGKGVAKDEARAFTVFSQACDAGAMGGCLGLGLMYETGAGGVARDDAHAAALFKQACDAADSAGCSDLGRMYARGRGVAKDEARGMALFKQACEQGNGGACANLGHAYWRGRSVPRDDAKAIALFKQACDTGGLLGCTFLGQAYAKGRGVPKDDVRAVALYQQACDGGNPFGCSSLGETYANGKGVAKDEARALALYQQSCDRNGVIGCTLLGELYVDGKGGVAKDDAHAVALFKQGCLADGDVGCFSLGWMYEKGVGVPVDKLKAIELYRKGCNRAEDAWDCAQLKRLGLR